MKQEVLKNFDQPWIPLTGLILFVVCFTIFCYWTYKAERKAVYEDFSQIPLNDPKRINQ